MLEGQWPLAVSRHGPGDINTCHKTLSMMMPAGHTCLTRGNSGPLLAFRSPWRRWFLASSANVRFLRVTWLHVLGELWFCSASAVRNANTALCLMAYTEDITLYVSICFACGENFEILLLYQSTWITCFLVASPKNALNSMYVTLVLTYKHVILLLHFW